MLVLACLSFKYINCSMQRVLFNVHPNKDMLTTSLPHNLAEVSLTSLIQKDWSSNQMAICLGIKNAWALAAPQVGP
jgi:hypothetical protein